MIERSIKLSVIIPVLNEEEYLPQCLKALGCQKEVEIIVVDGGSRDRSCEIAKEYGAILLEVTGGRAKQVQAGAARATGELLLFLHGDTLVPQDYYPLICTTLEQKDISCGAFSLGIEGNKISQKIVAWGANLRSRFLRLPYGDQGIFIKKDLYLKAGGFPIMPIMEDYVFIKTMASQGRIITLPQQVITSSRRWNNLGVFRTTAINQIIVILYSCGVTPTTLARIYQRLKGVHRTKESRA